MNKERREIELLQRALKCIGESSNEDLCDEIEVFLAQPEYKGKPLTSKLISLGNNCHESFIKGVRFAEKMHGIGVDDEN